MIIVITPLKIVSVDWGLNELSSVSQVEKTSKVAVGDRQYIKNIYFLKKALIIKLTGWRKTWKEIGENMAGQGGDVQTFTGGKEWKKKECERVGKVFTGDQFYQENEDMIERKMEMKENKP